MWSAVTTRAALNWSMRGRTASSAPLAAQAAQGQGPVAVDTVVVEGNERLQAQSIVSLFGVQPNTEITWRDVQRGIK